MAKNKVYITLEADDKVSAAFKKLEGNTGKAFDKIKTHAKAGAVQAGKMERAWEKSASHMKEHWKGYALAGGAALAATAYAIKRFADASSEEFKKYNTAVTDMGKITDESAESIKSKIGSIGPKYGDATELTKAYYNVISAGVTEPVAAMDTLKESVKAAKAAHIESAETVTGITALMEAYGDKIKGASESADLLFQIEASGKTTVKELIPYIGELAGKSAALGITQDELGASFAQVTLLSGSTSNAATQYKAILTSLMAPSEAMTKLLGKYGGAQKAIADMGFEGVLKLIAEESGGNAAALQKLMGSAEAVGGTLTLLGNDMAGYSQRLDDMKDKTGLAEKAFKDWEKSMEGIDATYDASIKNIMIAFGKEIAPMVANSMQMIIDMGPTIINTIHTAFDFVQVSYISLVDHVMRGLIDLEYAFKTMVAGIKGAWSDGINVLEEGFADFLDAVAAGLDKIPFFSDNATASMRDLADKVRANTDESEGFVTAIMKVQAAKEKEVAAHNDVIDAMMAEALGYKETALQAANASVKKQKAAEKAAKNIGKVQTSLTAAEIKAAKKLAKEKAKAIKDYAKESTKIYDRMYDDVQKLNLGDYAYNLKLLAKRYTNYKDHLEALARQDSKYSGGVQLLDQWMVAEKEKLWDDWARKHGTVLDRMGVRWRDYQKEGIDANRVMYDAISAGAAEMQKQLSDVFFNVLTGQMGKVKLDWDAMWKSMVRSTTDHMAKIVTETALNTATKAASAGMDWLGTAMGWWAAGSWEIKKQHMAMLHPGEMVVDAPRAEKLRAASTNGNIGLGEPMKPETALPVVKGSFGEYVDNEIRAAIYPALRGFLTKAAVTYQVGATLVPNPWGIAANMLRVFYKGWTAESQMKKLYGLLFGKDAPYDRNRDIEAGMANLDWSKFNADIANRYGLIAVNNPGYRYREQGRVGGGAGRGGFGGWGGGSFSGGSGATSYGGGGGSFGFARHGGLFSSPTIMAEHGREWAVPTYEPERSRFLKDVGADPDKLAAAIAKKIDTGSNNEINITINADVITTDDVDNWLAERIRRLNDYKVGDQLQTVDIVTAGLEI